MKPDVMLAYVSEKAKKGVYFLEIKLDKSKLHFIKMQSLIQKDGYIKLNVYMIESLATTIREYKTLRMSEFYGMSETILNPKKALMKVHPGEDRHKNHH
jgi:hypothetical protein